MSSKATSHWTKSTAFKLRDEIKSSEAVRRNEPCFIPSYEQDPKEYINFIMTEEYMRIWFKERSVYENAVYTKKQIQQDQAHIVRKFVQRDWKKRVKLKALPILKIEKYQNVACKTDTGRFRRNKQPQVLDDSN